MLQGHNFNSHHWIPIYLLPQIELHSHFAFTVHWHSYSSLQQDTHIETGLDWYTFTALMFLI